MLLAAAELDRINVSNDPVNGIDPDGRFFFLLAGPAAYTAGMALADLTIATLMSMAIQNSMEDDTPAPNKLFPNITPGGSCPNGDDDDETLQSRGNTIKQRTADHFGKNRREVGRALEALKKEHRLRNDFHGMRIMKSGNVIDKNSGQIIDNLWNYMH